MANRRHRDQEYDEPLLIPEPSTSTPSEKQTFRRRFRWRNYAVEPLLALYIISGMPLGSIRSQFMYQKVEESMGVSAQNFSDNGCEVNLSDPGYILQQEVQAQAANWSMYISLASFLPNLLMTVVYGIYSDQIGRRITFVLPAIGSILSTLADMAIIDFDLPLPFFFLEVIEYFFGGFNTLLMGTFAYIADICEEEKRAMRMTFVDCVLMLVAAAGELIVGFLIKAQGFLPPLYYAVIGKVLVLLYALFLLPDTNRRPTNRSDHKKKDTAEDETQSRGLNLETISQGFLLYLRDDGNGRRWKLSLLLMSYLMADLFSVYRIMTLFELDSPLCWNSVLIGYFGAASMTIKCVMSFITAFALRRCNMSEAWIAVIARTQSVAEYIYLSFVSTTLMMFLAPAIGCLSFLAVPMTRALMSNMVEKDKQGALFAVMISGASVCSLVSTLAVNKIYAATLLYFKGFIFLFAAGVLSLSLGLILIFIGCTMGFGKQKCCSRASGMSVQA